MKNIFVIDPSIMIHKIIELSFKDNPDYEIRFFSSYPPSADGTENVEYVFITIDLTGVEIEKAIKELKQNFKCRVIAMVPKFLDYNKEAIISAGADSILEKPFTSDELKNTLTSLSDSVALKEETIAEIDSETFEDIGGFDEDLSLSEADLLDVDKEILEQDVSGEEVLIDEVGEEGEEIEFDEKELEEELEDIDFSEEELEKDLESMDLSSIEEEAEEFEATHSDTELEDVSMEDTQKIDPSQVAQFREVAEELPGNEDLENVEQTIEFNEEPEEEFMAEVSEDPFEDVVGEDTDEDIDFERPVVEEVKPDEELEAGAEEADFFEQEEEQQEEIFEGQEDVESEEAAPFVRNDDNIVTEEAEFEGEGINAEEPEEEFMAEESEDPFEDVVGEDTDEDIDFERPVVEEVKPDEELEAGAEEADFFEQEEQQPEEMPIESAVEDAGDFFEKVEENKEEVGFVETTESLPKEDEMPTPEVKEPVFNEVKETVISETASLNLTDDDIEKIANKVIEKLSDKIIREIAWEVIPQLAEEIVLRRIKELEKEIE